MELWMEMWVRRAVARVLGDERGVSGTELLIIALLVFLIWLLSTGRKVVVQ